MSVWEMLLFCFCACAMERRLFWPDQGKECCQDRKDKDDNVKENQPLGEEFVELNHSMDDYIDLA